VGKRFGCQFPTAAFGERSLAKLRNQQRVIPGIGDNRHVFKVFSGGANHSGTADVDLLDRLQQRDALSGNRRGEGIEVRGDEVDGNDVVLV